MDLFSKKHPLSATSRQLRLQLLNLAYQAGESHLGGPLSSLDLLIALYFGKVFNFPPNHFVLSAGHLAPALYTVLAAKKTFPQSKLKTYTEFKSILQGHASLSTPGVEYASGSLGQGLSFATGLAIGDHKHHTICLTSDAEHQQGQIWEAAQTAAKYKLGNLINIVDRNFYQIDGSTETIMPLNNLAAKYVQFGWHVITINGHNFNQIISTLKKSQQKSDYPTCIIAKTIFAKGISFMQYDYRFHDIKNLSSAQYDRARQELSS